MTMREFWVLMALLLLALLFPACKTTKTASTSVLHSDSTVTAHNASDSLRSQILKRDSVFLHDSIYLYIKGDTVYKYVERIKYKTVLAKSDSSHAVTLHDTVFVMRTDTIVRTEVTERVKSLPWYKSVLMYVGVWALISLIVVAVWMVYGVRKAEEEE